MPMTLSFTDPRATELAVSGGKGASLSRSAQSLPVPPGIVITAQAYTDFLAPLQGMIAEALQGDVDAASAAIGGLDGHGVAVRSSGTLEDLPGAAFAGPTRHLPGCPRYRSDPGGRSGVLCLALERARHALPQPARCGPCRGGHGRGGPADGGCLQR